MAALKYSRQRESIKEYLAGTKEHPTADMVYMKVRQEFPNISLGTVYRNLNLLAELGEAVKISTPDGGDRFDGNVTPHCHFLCRDCGRMTDLHMEGLNHINELANRDFDGMIETQITTFYGICGECLKNKKNQN